jgi:hypothetical protein
MNDPFRLARKMAAPGEERIFRRAEAVVTEGEGTEPEGGAVEKVAAGEKHFNSG